MSEREALLQQILEYERQKEERGDAATEEWFQEQAHENVTENLSQDKFWYIGISIGTLLGAGYLGSYAIAAGVGALAFKYIDSQSYARKANKRIGDGAFYSFLKSEDKELFARTFPDKLTAKQKERLAKKGVRIAGYEPPAEPAKADELHPDKQPVKPGDRARLAVAGDRIHGAVDEYQEQQQQLGQSVGQRLADIPRNFAQGVAASIPVQQNREPISFLDDGSEFEWTSELLSYNAIMLFGAQGGGKTSKAAWILTKRVEQGAFAAVLDPFAAAANWEGLTVFGRGNNFNEIEKALAKFTAEAKSRINKRAFDKTYTPFNDTHWHFMLDEMTNWEKHVDPEIMGEFVDTCTQFLRQCNMSVTFCTHGETLACIGGATASRGKADVLKRQFLRLQVLPEAANVPGGFKCSGKAILKREDGEQTVSVPEWMQAPTNYDYRPYNPIRFGVNSQPQQPSQKSNPAYTVVSQAPSAAPNSYAPAQSTTIQQPQEDVEAYRPDWWGDKSRRLVQWQAADSLAKAGLSRSDIVKKMMDFKSEKYRGFAAALVELEEEFGKLSNQ